MKLSDYVIEFFSKCGVRHNFLVSGGAVIHLVDSTSRHKDMMYICGQHEEHSASAADMYARITRGIGLVMTTSGPGATNIVTSVASAYYDSIPLICLTGQVSRFRLRKSNQLRQLGFQETQVLSIFKSITKYSALILDPTQIRYELEKAIYYATEGRPGPCLLDIPDDLQRVEIDPLQLKSFTPPEISLTLPFDELNELNYLIRKSSKPLLIFGAGVQLSNTASLAVRFAEKFRIPVVTTWGGVDTIDYNHPLNKGCIGVCGPRSGNFAIQNSDLLIALGTRLCPMVTGGKQELFAPKAKKVMVDIDRNEIEKFDSTTFCIDLGICSSLENFFKVAALSETSEIIPERIKWSKTIDRWREQYPVINEKYIQMDSRVNPYYFIKELSKNLSSDCVVIGDTGANLSWTMQAFEVKQGQRVLSAWNQTPMGYSLPSSIGAALATNRDIIALIGDGGFMMCLQELSTIIKHNLSIKIFIFDNAGHGIQKQTIDTWLNSNYAAVDEYTGLSFPDYSKLAESFRIPFYSICNNFEVSNLKEILNKKGPVLCVLKILESQKINPMLKFGAGIEDLDPKLDRCELKAVMEHDILNENVIIR